MPEINLKVGNTIPIRFSSYTFYPKKGSIVTSKGEEIFMEPRLKDFFHLLLANKNDVVTREELMEYVWKDTVVTEDSISKAASDLRKFLEKNEIKNVAIITITKLGYSMKLLEIRKKENLFLSKKSLFRFAIYSLVVFSVCILLIRALRYEQ